MRHRSHLQNCSARISGTRWLGTVAVPFTPAVPLTSHNTYFDHHWYVWLPRHPIYEAVEVLVGA